MALYYKRLIQQRNIWMGIAILWIVLYHSGIHFGIGIFNYAKSIGYGGVDIFFFASGIGCYYSLASRDDVGQFMKRRITRLMPTYCIFIIFWLAYAAFRNNFDFQMALGNLFAIQAFTGLGNEFNWYISALFLFYILAPYFKKLIDNATGAGRLLFLLFLVACSVPFWGVNSRIIYITRLPIFYLGMLFSLLCQADRKVIKAHIVAACVSFLVGIVSLVLCFTQTPDFMWSYGLYWYPFILITIPVCMAVSWISISLEKFKIAKPILSFLTLCGTYSFEIYLTHILLFAITNDLIKKQSLENNLFVWVVSFLAVIVGCFLLRKATEAAVRILRKKKS